MYLIYKGVFVAWIGNQRYGTCPRNRDQSRLEAVRKVTRLADSLLLLDPPLSDPTSIRLSSEGGSSRGFS